ncbi:DUF624 domain-containing protein [Streptomyces sp. CB01635]|uniref:DUF624 domain-containing protein n=1 Tax=Streptomyces sp. CB01635 TaxID=2020326 RepID=UPI000D1C0FB5|nr:DUF624 domain-containing protein [Streptomyces sp. CB01635]
MTYAMATRRDPGHRDGRVRDTPYGERFTLFAEVIWIGVLVTLASLPLVTWPAAMAAGCAAVRRCVPDGPSVGTARRFAADWRRALRGGTLRGTAGLASLAFLAADLRIAAVAGDLPGHGLLVVVCAAAGVAVVVVQLRAAAAWSEPGDAGPATLANGFAGWRRVALARSRDDLVGSVILAAAVCATAVCAWQLLLLLPLVSGVLALAAVAVERRGREEKAARTECRRHGGTVLRTGQSSSSDGSSS